jgi:hypothetical protein
MRLPFFIFTLVFVISCSASDIPSDGNPTLTNSTADNGGGPKLAEDDEEERIIVASVLAAHVARQSDKAASYALPMTPTTFKLLIEALLSLGLTAAAITGMVLILKKIHENAF